MGSNEPIEPAITRAMGKEIFNLRDAELKKIKILLRRNRILRGKQKSKQYFDSWVRCWAEPRRFVIVF